MRQAALRAMVWVVLSLVACPTGVTFAEQGDRDKPVSIEADRLTVDDIKKESVFEGNVTVSQGTLTLKADKVVVRQDGGGFNYAYAYGKPAHFRQKRDESDEYVEGQGERLEYDGKADKMHVYTNAEIHKGADEVKGDYITYDATNGFYQVVGGPSVTTALNPKGRVRATIQPPRKAGDKTRSLPVPGEKPPVPLQPATSLPEQRPQ
jgi:lipopolysaccharide export system protein LptA